MRWFRLSNGPAQGPSSGRRCGPWSVRAGVAPARCRTWYAPRGRGIATRRWQAAGCTHAGNAQALRCRKPCCGVTGGVYNLLVRECKMRPSLLVVSVAVACVALTNCSGGRDLTRSRAPNLIRNSKQFKSESLTVELKTGLNPSVSRLDDFLNQGMESLGFIEMEDRDRVGRRVGRAVNVRLTE